MENSIEAFSIIIVIYQIFAIAFIITAIVLGIKLVLKLLKLMDSQTNLNNERLEKLRNE
ncbi:hypothetical protein IMCC3317_11120 [Kordia antarctica]|uniref:Uncharacterized protein n=1 Tax=Kordia antarctica TaxID=1218801 RepID=A0A7L4ZIL7_9FLAO|nr:hypothetical protein [Kordia antarctica]QHI35764.1 hypothetical protein IMCC3317_11120 [Kordia antarctica]